MVVRLSEPERRGRECYHPGGGCGAPDTPSNTHSALCNLSSACWLSQYCDEGLLNEVVYPLLTVQESTLLCISTLLDGGNHYSRLIEAKDDLGRRLFKTIQIDLICDDCKK